jgi:hypothetical protein
MIRRFVVAGVGIFLILATFIWTISSIGNKPQQDPSINKRTQLVDYANTDVVMRITKEGPIVARENHQVTQITIGQNERSVSIFEGYQAKLVKSNTFLNDPDAYRAFLAALDNNGFTKARIATQSIDPLSVCAAGDRYRYDIIDGQDVKQSLWSSSCGSSRGTFAGNASSIIDLFKVQIPDYNDFIKSLNN